MSNSKLTGVKCLACGGTYQRHEAYSKECFDAITAELSASQAREKRLREMLRQFEWNGLNQCPTCFAYKESGEHHRQDCEIAALLADAPAPVEDKREAYRGLILAAAAVVRAYKQSPDGPLGKGFTNGHFLMLESALNQLDAGEGQA